MAKVKVALFVSVLIIVVAALTKDEARTRLDKLLESSRLHGQRGLSWLNQQVQVMQEKSIYVLQAGTKLIMQENYRLVAEIVGLEQAGEKEGKNVTSCTTSREVLIRELSELARLELVACANRFLDQGGKITNNALVDFNRILKEVEDLVPALESCTNQLCLDTQVALIEFQEIDTPRKFQESVDHNGNKIEATDLLITECLPRTAENFINHGNVVLDEASRCVDKLIQG